MSGIRGYPIKEWLTSYYIDSSKRWAIGQLILTEKGVVFMKSVESKPKIKDLTLLRLDFDKMGEIKKKSTSLVFGAVVIIMIDGASHWFSSLKDRESVFNTLLHFWKYRLITAGSDYHRNKALSQDQTNLGKAILKVAHDSEATLQKAATSLHHQGEQLDGAIGNLCDIHNDLDVTDHMLSGLEQWLGRWCMPNERPHAVPVFVSDKDRPDVQVYDVIYSKMFAKEPRFQSPGSLVITNEGLTIHGARQVIVQYYKWKDVSRVKVLSPWEFIVSKFLIGQPDLSYSVTATKMVEILSHLQKRFRKIEYDAPPSSHLLPPAEVSKASSILIDSNLDDVDSDHYQQQIRQSCRVVSDSEVQELDKVLGNLKAMAVDIAAEQDQQMDSIDILTNKVDRANIRLETYEKRMKKL